MAKKVRSLKSEIEDKGKEEKNIEIPSLESNGHNADHEVRPEDDNGSYDDDYGGSGAGNRDFVPALLGEIKSFAVTPFGTYGLSESRLLRGVILFGTASSLSPNGKNQKSFVLDDMTGRIIVEVDEEEMPAIPSTVMVIGTLERRNGMNNMKAKYVKEIPLNETKLAGAWHTLKVVESINTDVKSAAIARELLKSHSLLTLVRKSRLSSNELLLRHVLFAVNAISAEMSLFLKEKEQQIQEGI